jgi:hypothetical protein
LKITEIVWLEDIFEKLERKHNVRQNEVIEVLENKPKFRFVEKGHHKGKNVYAALGQTYEGRYLIVFFVYKRNGQTLIISARNMTNAERRHYEQK